MGGQQVPGAYDGDKITAGGFEGGAEKAVPAPVRGGDGHGQVRVGARQAMDQAFDRFRLGRANRDTKLPTGESLLEEAADGIAQAVEGRLPGQGKDQGDHWCGPAACDQALSAPRPRARPVLVDPGLISVQVGAEVAVVQPLPHGLQRPSKAAGPQGTHQPPRKTKYFAPQRSLGGGAEDAV